MITPEQIAQYLKRVPPLPETLRRTLQALDAGDLAGAARAAQEDLALMHYLRQVVNSAAYGFRQELKEAPQIFSALGIDRARQLLYAYMVSVLAPEKWHFFDLDQHDFRAFQTGLMRRWEKLLAREGADEKYLTAAAVIAAGLVVADALFADRAEDVALLRQTEDLDLDTIMLRVSGVRFRQLVDKIAQKWEVPEEVRRLVNLAFGEEPCEETPSLCRLARLLHLLLFYELSRPKMMEAGANHFLSFHPEFVEPVGEAVEWILEDE